MAKNLVGTKKSLTFALAFREMQFLIEFLKQSIAEIAQLVEHNLAKVGVAGPSPVFRSTVRTLQRSCPGGGIGRRARFRCVCLTTCRFESCSGHDFLRTDIAGEVAELVDALL